jgi:hypothetical protein
LIAGLAAALALPRSADAFEHQQRFGVTTGTTFMTTNGGSSPAGLNFGLHYTYGLWDAVNLVVEADASGFFKGATPKNPPPEPGFVGTGGIGAVYVFDVLRWVPYAGGIAGAGYFRGGYMATPLWTPDLQLAAGLDYEITRAWTVGVSYREHFFVAEMNTYPAFASFGLRAEYVWGW